jgi:glycolate oxidase iron-sulfur subunit
VLAPRAQGCCGALPLHSGNIEQARALARRTIEVFEQSGASRIVVNAAGCGSAMKDYGELFAGIRPGPRVPRASAPRCATCRSS